MFVISVTVYKSLNLCLQEQNDCSVCLSEGNISLSNMISSFTLDESQKQAVLSSVFMKNCSHNGSKVKLIWGPPGTGKTKTVASLLFVLLKMKCRTLTCAPTNIAVVQVAKRVVGLLEHGTSCHRLGDIVLFGNEDKMCIKDDPDLATVFLSSRVQILSKSIRKWKSNLESMISFLRYPEKSYNEYVMMKMQSNEKGEVTDNRNLEADECVNRKSSTKKPQKPLKDELNRKDSESQNSSKTTVKSEVHLLTFEEYFEKTFFSMADVLKSCANSFCTHLPTSVIPQDVEKDLIGLVDKLKKLERARKSAGFVSKLIEERIKHVAPFTRLYERFPKPKFKNTIWDMCMENACLIFCTASNSIKVTSNMEMLIIDEAAQLKESESVIPLSITGLKNAVLIGDDRQLPAMVQSKVCILVYFLLHSLNLYQLIMTCFRCQKMPTLEGVCSSD